jgi:hypothetical protein
MSAELSKAITEVTSLYMDYLETTEQLAQEMLRAELSQAIKDLARVDSKE